MFTGKIEVTQTARLNISKASLNQLSNRLFVLSPKNSQLYDITDKPNPLLLSSFSLSIDNNSDLVTLLGIVKNIGYFSIGYNIIEVFDLLNERFPVSLGIINGALIGGKWLFYADNFLITNTKIPVIYHIDSPTQLKVIYEFAHEIADFVLVNNHLICATLTDGIKVYDISQPSNPHLVSSLMLNAAKLIIKDHNTVFAQSLDNMIYIIDVSEAEYLSIITTIKIPGPIASNSIRNVDDILIVRYMRKIAGDTTIAYTTANLKKPTQVFTIDNTGEPFYVANNKLFVSIGIKEWDGTSAISNYNTSLYKILSIESENVKHIDDIELDGIWFSSVILSDNVVYIARPKEVCVYKVWRVSNC